ncbi:MAG: hypothetical protein WAU01_02380 [Saprospiraceae bacterium]
MFAKGIFEAVKSTENVYSFFDGCYTSDDHFPSLDAPGVALIYCDKNQTDPVRIQLDKMKNHFKNLKIYDLGLLRSSDITLQSDIIQTLKSKNIVPIFVGKNIIQAGEIAAVHQSKICQVSNKIEYLEHNTTFIKCNYLGYQRHLCTLDDILEIEENSYDSLSLGKIRSFPYQIEPCIRDANHIHINLNVVRASEAMGLEDTMPTGLNAEELCQIMKYAGASNYLKAIYIDFTAKDQPTPHVYGLLATSIWYFIEGLNMNIKDHPDFSKDFAQFIVYSASLDIDLCFVKHNYSGKWWLKTESNPLEFLACAYEEYQASVNEDVPDRLMKFFNMMEEES